jgi:hypothetical protein
MTTFVKQEWNRRKNAAYAKDRFSGKEDFRAAGVICPVHHTIHQWSGI